MNRRLPSVPIPGPRRIPLLGPAGSLLRFFRDPVACLQALHRRYGAVAAVSADDASLVCAFGPEINHQVLSNPDLFQNAAEFPIRIPKDSALARLTTFLVGMNGDAHRTLRRAMAPLFQRSHLESHRDRIVATTDAVLSQWHPGQTVDLSAATAELSLCVAFRCLFNLDVASEARSLARLALGFTSGPTSLKVILAPLSVPGTPYWRYLRLCAGLEVRLRELVRDRRPTAGGRHDALSVLIGVQGGDGAGLSEALLTGLANELFIAGHETTARTLAWTLFLLERHPKVLGDLSDELAAELGGAAPTLAQLNRLPLLDAVVKESMRLLSATPFLFFRRSATGVRIGDYDLPAGASVVISPLITHHMAEIYPEPNRFHPQRWGAARPGPYEYLPFGAGPRTCLGASLANLSLRVMLSLILQRYRLSAPAGARISYRARGIVLGTKQGMPMHIRPHDQVVARPQPIRGNMHHLVDLPG